MPDLIPGEDDMDMSLDEELNAPNANAENEVKINITHRYVPKFDADKNTCTWIWVPYVTPPSHFVPC